MTTACLHQPNFLPWAKLLDKIVASDVWIVYDSAQYTRSEFHSRQRINTRQGPAWLSVPVVSAGCPRFRPLADVALCTDHDWRAQHLRLLHEHYRHTPYWPEVRELIEPVYRAGHTHLVDFNVALAEAMLGYLGARTRIVRASTLPHVGDRTDRLIQLNQAVGAGTHLTSTFRSTTVQIDWQRVADAGITVLDQEFTHPVYPQGDRPFVAGLSAVDLFCHRGRASAADLARQRHTPVVLAPSPAGSRAAAQV